MRIFQLFSPIFGLISYISGVISVLKEWSTIRKINELVFCYTFRKIGGGGSDPSITNVTPFLKDSLYMKFDSLK